MKNKFHIRKSSQLFFLGVFICLIFLNNIFFIPPDFFLKINPLITIFVSIASREIITGIGISFLVVIFTFFIGRFFCGYICPLGTLLDIIEKIKNILLFKSHKEIRISFSFRHLKYYLLLVIFIFSLFGVLLLPYFDPISLITRFFTIIIFPTTNYFLNFLLNIFRPLAIKFNLINLIYKHYETFIFFQKGKIFTVFIIILSLSLFQERFWCRNLCPLGALLSIFSKFSLFKKQIKGKCTGCNICVKKCKMNAINLKSKATFISECIQCMKCVNSCPEKIILFERRSILRRNIFPDISKRIFLKTVFFSLLGIFLVKTEIFPFKKKKVIRPPGVRNEKKFLSKCLRCGKCFRICPTNTLQPIGLERGLEGLWTPQLVMKIGHCERNCNKCGKICPTGAIPFFLIEEKQKIKIGQAVISKDKCLAWGRKRICVVCDEVCPYNSIEIKYIEELPLPIVNQEKCVGCGQCEYKCPAENSSAIIIYPY